MPAKHGFDSESRPIVPNFEFDATRGLDGCDADGAALAPRSNGKLHAVFNQGPNGKRRYFKLVEFSRNLHCEPQTVSEARA